MVGEYFNEGYIHRPKLESTLLSPSSSTKENPV